MAYLQVKTFSKSLRTKTDIQVILPTPLTAEIMNGAMYSQFERNNNGTPRGIDYFSENLNCPVLYLLHGTYGDDGDWMRFSRIESYAQEYNIAIVMPDAENSCYRNMVRGGPKYYDYFTGELQQMVRWMFPVSRRREDTFITGLSMGASGAFYIGMSRPDLFSHVACLSGGYRSLSQRADSDESVWSNAFLPGEKVEGTTEDCYWLASNLVNSNVEYPNLYMCCGTEDFVYESNSLFREHLENIGFKHDYHEQPGVHNWDFWDDEIKRILKWLPINRR